MSTSLFPLPHPPHHPWNCGKERVGEGLQGMKGWRETGLTGPLVPGPPAQPGGQVGGVERRWLSGFEAWFMSCGDEFDKGGADKFGGAPDRGRRCGGVSE
jgi:hypothetical protein